MKKSHGENTAFVQIQAWPPGKAWSVKNARSIFRIITTYNNCRNLIKRLLWEYYSCPFSTGMRYMQIMHGAIICPWARSISTSSTEARFLSTICFIAFGGNTAPAHPWARSISTSRATARDGGSAGNAGAFFDQTPSLGYPCPPGIRPIPGQKKAGRRSTTSGEIVFASFPAGS